ncbi:MAG: hypothetical protein D6695_04495, partial [Planctomycetota bacterium]
MRSVVAVVLVAFVTCCAHGTDDRRDRARPIIDRAIAYLRAHQDGESGGWAHRSDGPDLPAITGLVVTGLLEDPRIDQNDPAVRRGVAYMLSFRKPDGTIHDGLLPSYNTAICLSTLARVHTCDAADAIEAGQEAIRAMQWQSSIRPGAQAYNEPVSRDHPYFGGIGYGKHGRPDLSNLGFALEALHDTGVSANDEAFQRALTFLARTQMVDAVNDMQYADGSRQGGFIYATVPNAESVDGRAGQSMAGLVEEEMEDGTRVSRLRAYGSMSYVGFKSLIYADLPRDDLRVRSALGWIERNYTLDENPGMGDEGRYYYYVSMARALDAWGSPTLRVYGPEGSLREVDWREDLIDAIGALQEPDGSFRVLNDRWMENNKVLITAYALIAL